MTNLHHFGINDKKRLEKWSLIFMEAMVDIFLDFKTMISCFFNLHFSIFSFSLRRSLTSQYKLWTNHQNKHIWNEYYKHHEIMLYNFK